MIVANHRRRQQMHLPLPQHTPRLANLALTKTSIVQGIFPGQRKTASSAAGSQHHQLPAPANTTSWKELWTSACREAGLSVLKSIKRFPNPVILDKDGLGRPVPGSGN